MKETGGQADEEHVHGMSKRETVTRKRENALLQDSGRKDGEDTALGAKSFCFSIPGYQETVLADW